MNDLIYSENDKDACNNSDEINEEIKNFMKMIVLWKIK